MTAIYKSKLIIIIILVLLVGVTIWGLSFYLLRQGQEPLFPGKIKMTAAFIPVPDRVAEITPDSGQISLKNPLGVTATAGGQVIVADTGNNRVMLFDPEGRLSAKFGELGSSDDQFNYPVTVAVNSGGSLLYIADFNNSRIQVWDLATGQYQYTIPREKDLELTGPIQPVALSVDQEDKLFVSDVSRQRVVVFDQSGNYLYQFGEPGKKEGQFQFANGLAMDDKEGLLYVADTNNGRIQLFDKQGKFVKSIVHMGKEQLLVTPRGIALDKSKDLLYIADTVTHRVYVYELRTQKVGILGMEGSGPGQLSFPNGLALDTEGRLYVADRGNNRIVLYQYRD